MWNSAFLYYLELTGCGLRLALALYRPLLFSKFEEVSRLSNGKANKYANYLLSLLQAVQII